MFDRQRNMKKNEINERNLYYPEKSEESVKIYGIEWEGKWKILRFSHGISFLVILSIMSSNKARLFPSITP